MTVREGEANSHQNKGWETFTDAVVEQLASKSDIVYLLWGNPAQAKYVSSHGLTLITNHVDLHPFFSIKLHINRFS